MNYKKIKRNTFRLFLFGFAAAGIIFFFVFIAMQFGWLNVRGSVSQRNSYFNIDKKSQVANINNTSNNNFVIICKINVLNKYAPLTSGNIFKTLTRGANDDLINKMIDSASVRFNNDFSFKADMENCRNAGSKDYIMPISAYAWADTDQWNLMREVFTRDQDIIRKAAQDSGVSPRILMSGVIGEQFRFFNNSRDSFKSYFEPLKILASLSKFSYGIGGLKPQTVATIEANLKDVNSPFYLGPSMEHIADYKDGVDVESERMNRITDSKNPYYTYLYVGLYMKEILAQWQKAGYDISARPDVLATLYNLGFYYSVPKDNPEAGGAIININNTDYTFGDIAYEFYYSGELSDIFPIGVQ
jgi:hypothetical protein